MASLSRELARWVAALRYEDLPPAVVDHGKVHTRQGTGREFIWDFEEEARRIPGVIPVLPIPGEQFEEMIATCGSLDREARADKLVGLTLSRKK
jgi:hypothetical protein